MLDGFAAVALAGPLSGFHSDSYSDSDSDSETRSGSGSGSGRCSCARATAAADGTVLEVLACRGRRAAAASGRFGEGQVVDEFLFRESWLDTTLSTGRLGVASSE